MSTTNDQQIAANYTGAVAHILSGKPGRHAEFIQKVELILSGNEPHAMQLMQFSDRVARTGRPVIWIYHSAASLGVPQIGLVALSGGQVYMIENCWLWAPNGRGRAHLIPDNFAFGAFRFDDQLRLRRAPTPPVRTFEAARPKIVDTYVRLREIEAEQRQRGEAFLLPVLAKAA
jgi:hypothetical protein